ncbi:CLUMA_CG018925, isoform A [Clunio marinus]|uniref:CLUMA_CG018925, isoform A n=1 Tax=Clunio marinus TaxID=568069 RepID=A0A1J1J0Q2_9DIPT|nr:CLUMA_CG018925, isoform A [Clunio marinus]
MKASLGINGLKTFTKVIKFLSRIGNELYFEAVEEALILRVINSSKTCFCSVTFHEEFFVSYEQTGTEFDENSCRISARPLLHILKNIKNVINCRLHLDSIKERLIVNIYKQKDIQKHHGITILEHEVLEDHMIPESPYNLIVCQPLILGNLINHIPKSLRELSIAVNEERLEVTNHIDHPDKDVETVRLKYPLDPQEFTSYDVSETTRLIFSSQDFLSMVEFSESSNQELKLIFTKGGKPLIAAFENELSYKVQMVLATIREESIKSLRKPAGATSYKELMGSYMETRRSFHGIEDNHEKTRANATVTNSCLSPFIESYGSNAKSKEGKISTCEHLRNNFKRKNECSEDLFKNQENNADVANVKKQKTVLSQKEQEEISQIEAIVENMDDDDEKVLEEAMKSQRLCQSSDFNFLAGLEDMNVKVHLQESPSFSRKNSQACERLDISKAHFPSELLMDDEEEIINNQLKPSTSRIQLGQLMKQNINNYFKKNGNLILRILNIVEYESSPSKKTKIKKNIKKPKQLSLDEDEIDLDIEDSFSSPNTSGKSSKNQKGKKKPVQQDDTSSDEERWLEAIETGKLEEVDDELKKIKPKDPKLMTARQRAMYEKNVSDNKDLSPSKVRKSMPSTTIVDGVQANVSSSGQLLLALPNFKYKEKEKLPLTAEDIEKSKEKAQKRKALADEKREKDKKKTMERLLKKQDSKMVKSTKMRPVKQQLPVISYKNTFDKITLTFPPNIECPIKAKTSIDPPKPKLCGIEGCKNLKRYNCSRTNIPLCSFECYKKNVESVKHMIL